MRGLLASHRRRRRLIRFALVAAVAVGIALLIAFVRNTGRSFETPLRKGPAQVYRPEPTVPLTPDAARAARVTMMRFIRSAVLRDHVEDSWELAAPSLRQGYTRRQWKTGAIPVIPYPADLRKTRYRVEYSHPKVVGIALSLWPKRGSNQRPMVFGIELTKAGSGRRTHWLVSSFAPRVLPSEIQPTSGGGRAYTPTGKGPLGAAWLFVPVALLAGVLLVPLAIGLRSWHRGRRAMRDYEKSFSSQAQA